jgi:hypothetical protein
MRDMRWFTIPTLGVLVLTAAYEAALAAGLIGFTATGAPPSWESTAVLGSCLVMALAGSGFVWIVMLDAVTVLDGASARVASMWSVALIPCVAAGAVLARWFTPDPYYLPATFRRLSEGGIVGAPKIALVLLLALVAVVIVRRYAAPGLWACSGSLWFSALVMLVAGLGH